MRFMDVKTITELRKYLLENRDVKSLFFHESPHSEKGIEFVQVVRCMDCENWVENEHCLAWAYEYSDANGYCYLGKRREDGGTVTYYANDKPVETIVIDERKEDE